MKHYPMTEDQRLTLNEHAATIIDLLKEITGVLRACYDDQDAPVWRAEEARAAMQRLLWALERQVPGRVEKAFREEEESEAPALLP